MKWLFQKDLILRLRGDFNSFGAFFIFIIYETERGNMK